MAVVDECLKNLGLPEERHAGRMPGTDRGNLKQGVTGLILGLCVSCAWSVTLIVSWLGKFYVPLALRRPDPVPLTVTSRRNSKIGRLHNHCGD